MKIAQLAPPFLPVPPPDEGGTERIISYLCEELTLLGHEVTLFAPSDSEQGVKLVGTGQSVLTRDDPPPSLPGAMEAIALGELVRRKDEFDVIHCHTEFLHHPALASVREKTVTTLHWRVDEADRQEVYHYYNNVNVIAISEDQASRLSGGRISVIHHGLPTEKYFATQSSGPGVAFIGRMTDQKRPDMAIRVAQKAGRPISIAGAIDVGNPAYFHRHVEPLLSGNATHVGRVDDSAKQRLLGNSAALLFPIDWDEPFGLVMIEAMATGCPVIAWNRGSVPEVIEDGVSGFIVDSEEGAEAALRSIEDLDRAKVRESFERRFTARRMAEDHVELYRQLCGRENYD